MVSDLYTEKASAAPNPDMAHGAIWCVHTSAVPTWHSRWLGDSRGSITTFVASSASLRRESLLDLHRKARESWEKQNGPQEVLYYIMWCCNCYAGKITSTVLGYFFAWGPRFSILFPRKWLKRYLILVHRSCAHLFCLFWPGAWRACLLLCNFNPFRSFPKSLSPTTIGRFHFWSQRHFIQNRSALSSPYDEADRTHNVNIISIAATSRTEAYYRAHVCPQDLFSQPWNAFSASKFVLTIWTSSLYDPSVDLLKAGKQSDLKNLPSQSTGTENAVEDVWTT